MFIITAISERLESHILEKELSRFSEAMGLFHYYADFVNPGTVSLACRSETGVLYYTLCYAINNEIKYNDIPDYILDIIFIQGVEEL